MKQNILIITNGTRGDIEPFINLALGLQTAGYNPTICAPSSYADLITANNIKYAYMNDGLPAITKSPEGRMVLDGYISTWRYLLHIRKLRKPLLATYSGQISDSYRAVKKTKPDLIIFNHVSIYGRYLASLFQNLPIIFTLPSPALVPTSDTPQLLFPKIGNSKTYNKATYHLMLSIVFALKKSLIKGWYQEQIKKGKKLPPPDYGSKYFWQQHQDTLVLHHYSRHFANEPKDWRKSVKVVGYWFRPKNKPQKKWSPEKNLVKFLSQSPKPIYIGFGSMLGTPSTVNNILMEIKKLLEKTNHRFVVGGGWGGKDWRPLMADKKIAKQIYFIKDVPHDWLFPKMSAVIHHGGAGTTAAGLLAGKPSIICPFFADQYFWAQRIKKLHLGIPLPPPKKLTSKILAKAIDKVLHDATMQKNAKKIAQKLKKEDGVKNTIAMIDTILKG